VNKNFKYDDAKEWDQFLTHLKNVVFKYHVPKKIIDPTDGKPLKKRVSSKTIMTSMNEVDTISTSELQNLMDEVW
jgi:sortase (surface protein transpeptidase)